jgi:hypothetical protein
MPYVESAVDTASMNNLQSKQNYPFFHFVRLKRYRRDPYDRPSPSQVTMGAKTNGLVTLLATMDVCNFI